MQTKKKKRKEVKELTSYELFNLMQDTRSRQIIVDLRKKRAFDDSHIDSSVNFPHDLSTVKLSESTKQWMEWIKQCIQSQSFGKIDIVFDIVFVTDISQKKQQGRIKNENNDEEEEEKKKKSDQIINKNDSLKDWLLAIETTINKPINQKISANYLYNEHYMNGKLYPSLIEPFHIWLCNWGIANNPLLAKQLEYVYKERSQKSDVRCHYFRVPIVDDREQNLLQHLHDATDWMHAALLEKKDVLVHCRHGQSRSASVVIAYLIKYQHMTLDQAWDYVKQRRDRIAPNPGFREQLERFEKFVVRQYTNSIQT
ncbi:Dual specificity phosphatase, catalytic domain containing protein [Reticulomyxa filosa]|uniref:protein-tyrosine-phosphatase n=1 Tax=Reticulomyxa filosa TaxID=46433 RepID=X6MW65_RETFI|nr:Dual specificity phosphatase, catalytic domain containing protein [Reticulomyxa filosa]|eukprot:ETO17712.1 Dual specificity phosphatase, catalytic domain containing protein [Reticulomyxa filosa]